MNYTNSFANLYQIISGEKNKTERKPGYFSLKIINFLNSFTKILKTCDGRDKLCALIQYSSKFYSTIEYHRIDLENVLPTDKDPFHKHDALKNIEKSMSSGRKIFRFLKWIEDIKGIYYYIIYKNTSLRNIFKGLMKLSSMFYHLFDNLVWSSNMGVISEYLLGDIKLKNTKNLFAFLRNLIKIFMDIIKFKSLYNIIRENYEEMNELFEKNVEYFQTHLQEKLLDEVFYLRAKLRSKALDIVHSFLRICMLMYSLKIEPFYSNLHPIFTGLCGMIHSIISIYKAIYYNDNSHLTKNINENNLKRRSYHYSSYHKLNRIQNNKSKNHDLSELNYLDNKNILDPCYFDNYYIDFNKDFPIHPSNVVIAANSKQIFS